jgi:hypothetical protein
MWPGNWLIQMCVKCLQHSQHSWLKKTFFSAMYKTFHVTVVLACSILCQTINIHAYGGLVVSVLASGTQDRGFKPGRSRRIFRAKKTRLPSEVK